MIVDDYARYEADSELLRSECFPFGDPDGAAIDLLAIDSGLLALAGKDMLMLYEVGGKRYLQLTRWQERTRSESKWPDPKNGKMLSNDSSCQQMFASPSPSPSPSPPSPSPVPRQMSAEPAGRVERVVDASLSEARAEIGEMFGRGPGACWQSDEEHYLAETVRRPDYKAELATIKEFISRPGTRYAPESVFKLLEKWNQLLDRAKRPRKDANGAHVKTLDEKEGERLDRMMANLPPVKEVPIVSRPDMFK